MLLGSVKMALQHSRAVVVRLAGGFSLDNVLYCITANGVPHGVTVRTWRSLALSECLRGMEHCYIGYFSGPSGLQRPKYRNQNEEKFIIPAFSRSPYFVLRRTLSILKYFVNLVLHLSECSGRFCVARSPLTSPSDARARWRELASDRSITRASSLSLTPPTHCRNCQDR
jgi:hypothetical protein